LLADFRHRALRNHAEGDLNVSSMWEQEDRSFYQTKPGSGPIRGRTSSQSSRRFGAALEFATRAVEATDLERRLEKVERLLAGGGETDAGIREDAIFSEPPYQKSEERAER
jgi:hypothetical protein